MKITFGSVCSGIEAASVALNPQGYKSLWFSEVNSFCSELIKQKYTSPNLGDMFNVRPLLENSTIEAPDFFLGGTPCQSFSLAGLRKSLSDERGSLSLEFIKIADTIDSERKKIGKEPCVILWENVPGCLNTKDNFFGEFLAGLAGEESAFVAPGGRWSNSGVVHGGKRNIAWRILDSQYFGVPQRRKRVFVVASARNNFDPCEVLFESKSLSGDFKKVKNSKQKTKSSLGKLSENGLPRIVGTLCADSKTGAYSGQDAYTGRLIPDEKGVRKLTPIECERLQGFPDNYTCIFIKGKQVTDAPRYRALGNSWSIPVIEWIGCRVKKTLEK